VNTTDLLTRWSALSLEEIEARLESGADEEAAKQLFAADDLAEMRTLMEAPRARGLREAVVLLPGCMGSLLRSIHGVTTLLWINPSLFLKGQCNYLELNQNGTTDAYPCIDAMPFSVEKLSYIKIAMALRRQADLYEFPYDWRLAIEHNADLLHQYIERWADGNPKQQFTLVGHSMGGLVARAYLARHTEAAETRIKHLIMHGTPHYGVPGMIETLVLGNRMMAIAAKLNEKNVPRRVILSMPSLFQLLPAPPDLFLPSRPYPVNWDLYDAAAWRLEGIRQDYLDSARRFHELLASAYPQVEISEIAGCHVDTIVEVQRSFDPNEQPQFELIRMREGPDSGDGTIPLWSAAAPGAEVYYIQQVHRSLPANKRVIAATLELMHGGQPALPTDLPPPRGGMFRRAAVAPVDIEADRLRACLEEGTASAEDLSLLYFAM